MGIGGDGGSGGVVVDTSAYGGNLGIDGASGGAGNKGANGSAFSTDGGQAGTAAPAGWA